MLDGQALKQGLGRMLACVVPTRRALAVEPAEALNVEG